MNLIEDIDSYINAMREIQDSINQLQGERLLKNHQKTLLFSLLETISNGVYGDRYRNADRFKKFILEFCEWEEAERVSLQQLFLVFKEGKPSQEFRDLKIHVLNGLQDYPPASPVPFSCDSTLEEIKALMPNNETTINGVDIHNLTHVNLLWKYRNALVHEARSKGAMELFDGTDYPHYVHFTKMGKNGEWEVWKISYPIKFFNSLIDKALVNVRETFIDMEHDPRSNYDFGELWVKSKQMK
ncbi:hypothetical protein [Jeotgalibacillus haloalkalitolerans]|uniref:RiboL-PSP-HEPN domain-containing protein n=1 Tax=Jeotgalibacillus haloalkalitolerans TaxID=3104292 RepID=A0ABU5KNF9_9BACL|nr:hypothetical protein [Jeotgalibacillus sp. HH7-29]MDZ5712794.1 hypothetical protein [Jeotgalibacillus sp. HH7-29]